MNCVTHLERSAVGVCCDCGKHICDVCLNKEGGKMYCDLCARLKSERAEREQSKQPAVIMNKSRTSAILFAFFLGGIGGHKFYLGQAGWGILYLLFCWTFIPAVVALIEMIIFITLSDEEFSRRYGSKILH